MGGLHNELAHKTAEIVQTVKSLATIAEAQRAEQIVVNTDLTSRLAALEKQKVNDTKTFAGDPWHAASTEQTASTSGSSVVAVALRFTGWPKLTEASSILVELRQKLAHISEVRQSSMHDSPEGDLHCRRQRTFEAYLNTPWIRASDGATKRKLLGYLRSLNLRTSDDAPIRISWDQDAQTRQSFGSWKTALEALKIFFMLIPISAYRVDGDPGPREVYVVEQATSTACIVAKVPKGGAHIEWDMKKLCSFAKRF